MSDKFRNIVNAPHRTLGKLKEKIENKNPDSALGKIARGAGIGTTATTQFLLWLTKYIALDNHITRAGERGFAKIKVGKNKNGKDKKIPKFIQSHPNFTSIVSWWMLLAALSGGGRAAFDIIYNQMERDDESFEPGTYGVYFDNVRTITPFLIADLIAKEGVHVDKNGMHTPYKDSKGIWTIGFGSTKLKDGTRVKENTQPITTEEAYELARWHLEEGETYFGMYCYDVMFDGVNINDANQALAIGSIMYNSFSNLIEKTNNRNCNDRFTLLRKLYNENGRGLSDEMVRDLFERYPVNEATSFGNAWLGGADVHDVANKLGGFLAGGAGMYWRRWLEAGLLTGDITPQMLLDCPVNGMYEFFKCMGRSKDAFFIKGENGFVVNKKTYDLFRFWLKNPVSETNRPLTDWKKVRDYMPEYALSACDGRICKLGDKASKQQREYQKKVEKKTYVLDYENAYDLAIKAYRAGDYESAAQQLESIVIDNPNNALLHNDLAATYNHLGRYEDAIKHVREIVRRIGDKSQYGAAQYNAGFAYEQMGQLDKALANYKLAVANGNRGVQSDITRVKNKLNNRTTKAAVFDEASGRVRLKIKDIDNTHNNMMAEGRL